MTFLLLLLPVVAERSMFRQYCFVAQRLLCCSRTRHFERHVGLELDTPTLPDRALSSTKVQMFQNLCYEEQ